MAKAPSGISTIKLKKYKKQITAMPNDAIIYKMMLCGGACEMRNTGGNTITKGGKMHEQGELSALYR